MWELRQVFFSVAFYNMIWLQNVFEYSYEY